MQAIMYSLYVGNYANPAATKEDIIKLNKLGLKGFVFSRGNHYAIKAFSSPDAAKTNYVKECLEKNHFIVELEAINLKTSLHL